MRRLALFVCVLLCGVMALRAPQSHAQVDEVVIGATAVRDYAEISPDNVEVVEQADAWNGLAVHFTGGVAGNPPPSADPEAWFQIDFELDAGTYFVWIRGMGDEGGDATDALWLQFDDEIGTVQHRNPGTGMGNWRNWTAVGAWDWAGNIQAPHTFTFDDGGTHEMLVQPRQVPHYIDQIWFTMDQDKRPTDPLPYEGLDDLTRPVSPVGMLAATWGEMKSAR